MLAMRAIPHMVSSEMSLKNTRGWEVEGQVEGLPHPGRRCKLQGQRVDPLPPPWGNMVNYVADPLPAVLWVAKLGRGYPPPGVGNGVNYTRRGSNSGKGPDGLATLAASVSGDDGRCSADGGGDGGGKRRVQRDSTRPAHSPVD